MPRQMDSGAIYRKLLSVNLYVLQTGTTGDTTTTAPVLGDGTEATVGVTASTNFTSADPCFIYGDGGLELVKIGTPATTMPVSYKPKLPQSTGARFVEAKLVSLGKVSESGLQVTPNKTLTAIISAVDDLPVAYIESPVELTTTFGLLEWEGLNWQMITGFADEETGTGTNADPYQAVIGKLNQTLQGLAVIRHTGIRHDGKYVQQDFLDARFEVSGGIDHNRQAPAILPVTVKYTKMIVRRATAAFTN